MKITIENYESYALDFLQGQLGHQDEIEFQQFLDDHPTIKKEIAGIDQVVLSPDLEMRYPDKESLYRRNRGGIIPLWNVNRLVAAAVAFLLVSASVLFYWNTSYTPHISLTDNQSTKVQDPTEQTELPATKTPMPAEQSETNVMAHEGNVPDLEENIIQSSPALTFGQAKQNNRTITSKDIVIEIDSPEPIVTNTFLIHEAQKPETDQVEIKPEETFRKVGNEPVEVVAFLPGSMSSVITTQPLSLESLNTATIKESTNTFEIHIPGQFLSETWTDVSLANFKNNLLPEFLNIRNNQ